MENGKKTRKTTKTTILRKKRLKVQLTKQRVQPSKARGIGFSSQL